MKRNSSSQPVFSFIFFLSVRILFIQMVMTQNATIPVKIGVVLDFDDWVGKMGLSCINMSLSEFYDTHPYYKTRLVLHSRDSKKDDVGAAAAALDLVKNMEVQAIIGPSTSMQTNFVVKLGEKARVPIISFSASSSSIPSSYFFRATQNDQNQAQAIAAIIKFFRWKEAVPIYVDNVFGNGMIPYLTNCLQTVDTRVPYQSVISPSASDDQILKELYKLMSTMHTRVFIVHMFPSLGTRLFTKAKEIGMMSEGYVWIVTAEMTDLLSSFNPSVIDSMQGVLGVKPYVPKSKEMEDFRVIWKKKFHRDNPDLVDAELSINGLWAYDTITALAMAVEKAGTENLHFQMAKVSSSSVCLESFGVSLNGPNLVQALSNISFKGITGNFLFLDGQLQSSSFQIVNVDSNVPREVGFWTPEEGLVRKLNSLSSTGDTISPPVLATIIWPGDTASVPKGWENPIKGKRLLIGVPVKEGFTQFVNMRRDPITNTLRIDGLSIDIFEAALKELPYALPYEYIPFVTLDGNSSGSYDNLVYQVYLGKFDGAVGDISILVNRSYYVEYTLPFMDFGGISMIVPMEDNKSRNTWIFLKPLTWGVWVTSICFFVFIGFVVWVLEHKINEDFQGPPSHQIGTSFWFSFSAMFFAHREKVVSNLARIVVITWCFVGLVLTQSYAAALSSFLTVQQLQPAINDINVLIQKRDNVGYQEGSYVFGILKSLGFTRSQLLPYRSAEECNQLLSKGSGSGGIAAAIDEAPFINTVLAQNCSKYTVVETRLGFQQLITNGFGFVFPRGSPLVADVSTAIFKLKENNEIKNLEQKWFGSKEANCSARSYSVSNRLGLDRFSGLFFIAGTTSLLALITYIAMIAFQNRQILFNPRVSMLSRILDLLAIFQKHFNSHSSPKSGSNIPGNSALVSSAPVHSSGEQEVHSDSEEHVGPSPNGQNTSEPTNPNQERPAFNDQEAHGSN